MFSVVTCCELVDLLLSPGVHGVKIPRPDPYGITSFANQRTDVCVQNVWRNAPHLLTENQTNVKSTVKYLMSSLMQSFNPENYMFV